MTRGYPPPPWMALPWKEKAKVSLSLPLLRAEGGDEEAQVGLEATDADSRSGGLAVAARYCLVVNVNRGLHSGDVIQQRRKQNHKTASCVGDHWEKGNVKGLVWSFVLTVHTL